MILLLVDVEAAWRLGSPRRFRTPTEILIFRTGVARSMTRVGLSPITPTNPKQLRTDAPAQRPRLSGRHRCRDQGGPGCVASHVRRADGKAPAVDCVGASKGELNDQDSD